MIIDHTGRGHIQVTGDDRVRFLQGMCTANVETLSAGDWTRASILDHKGRVQSIIEIAHRDDHLLISCDRDLRDKTQGLLEKYAIMDDVVFTPVELAVHRVWDGPDDVWNAPPIFQPPPGPVADAEAVEILRVEAGMPRYGVDVTDAHFPFESLLRQHIDYEKGCYLGQEPVSRVHHRGNPNKAMRGLRLQGEGPVPRDAQVQHEDRAQAGVVTSSLVSPTFGPIALAYLHRQINQPGSTVTVGDRSATVVELPFR